MSVADLIVSTDPSLASLSIAVQATTETLFVDTLLGLVDPGLGRFTRPVVLQLAQEALNEGVTLAAVLRALNQAQAGITEALLHECERLIAPGDQGAIMRAIVTEVVSTHNQLADTIVDMHSAADDPVRFLDETESAVLAALLNGRVRPERFEQVTRYPLDRIHVAAVAFSKRREPQKLVTTTVQALESMGCDQIFKVMIAPNVLWAWGSVRTADDLHLEPPTQCNGWTLAVGLPGRGAAGFIASHDEARAMQRVATMAGWRNLGRILSYDQYGAVAELAARPERLRRFLEVQLGGLLGAGGRETDLRSTMLEYLNVNRSQYAAARRLHVSKNTVSYRLRRAEEILGRDLGTDLSPLHTALLATDILGASGIAEMDMPQAGK
ncbi:PucR family transcriptional regulator [Gryllotalpicola sp.]|uniref:PucR family transcriptional regulator n=1 Tax=Gryllotalpicola sp. TaxID=1932787 RepID=UPI002608D9F5|nr:PucR family transcriptional regulator [Gryllotalpicola sp.]